VPSGARFARLLPPAPGVERAARGRLVELALIHLPVRASRLNQVEILFSVLRRKALWPKDLDVLATIEERLLAFGRHYQQIAEPLQSKLTRADLDALLDRLDRTRNPRAG
jgi:hypothetical protein